MGSGMFRSNILERVLLRKPADNTSGTVQRRKKRDFLNFLKPLIDIKKDSSEKDQGIRFTAKQIQSLSSMRPLNTNVFGTNIAISKASLAGDTNSRLKEDTTSKKTLSNNGKE